MGMQRLIFCCFLLLVGGLCRADGPARPNILWLTCEDTGPHLKCYGFDYAETPHLDALAGRSLRYRKCWSNAPVCAPARTTLITGMYPTSLGAEHMRSEVRIPDGIRLYPELLRAAGYYCTNNDKTDYNVPAGKMLWDETSKQAHYRNRAAGQPFFAVFNFTITHESQIRSRPHRAVHDPARAPLPAYHPDTPEVRQDWAQYHDNVTTMDGMVGKALAELQAAGLAEDTIVFFYGDHGSGMPRSKRWPFNSGLQVPLIIHFPDKFKNLAPADYRAGGWSERLVSFVDFAPTVLSLAGVKAPAWQQGRAFLGPQAVAAPEYLFGFRGRMDERTDFVRSLTDGRFVYVRNFLPHLIYGQHLDFMFQTPTTRVWKALFDAGKLAPPQTFFWQRKPAEELYDLQSDPDEVKNLAAEPAHAARLEQYREASRRHLVETRDTGFLTESEMHRRAGGDTIHAMAQDPVRYPLGEIMAAADAASLPSAAPPDRAAGLQAKDAAVRYWTVSGLLMGGREAAVPLLAAVRPLLKDESASVQTAAAEVLAWFGTEEDAATAVAVLKTLAPAAAHGPLVSLEVLAALERVGARAGNLESFLNGLDVRAPNLPSRYREYAPRLLQDLVEAGSR
jgi:arylsulfatase A-like enzyme